MTWRVTSPRDAALHILAVRSGAGALSVRTSLSLADFQQEAVTRASSILHARGGVLIADSVGLGKTFIGLGLIEQAVAAGERVLLVVPACLRPMWRTELRRLPLAADHVHLVSHTGLALGAAADARADLVVVDEAHAFRNGRTRRYRALRAACRSARVVLLTATPVNNSLSDLYFQLRLFCSDTAFRDLGIGSLREALLLASAPDERMLLRLKATIMVRRTRADVRPVADPTFRFPGRVLTHAVGYALPLPVEAIGAWLDRLTFVAYGLGAAARFSPEVLRFGLLKRFDSSVQAMRMTLGRQIRFHEQLLSSLKRGRLLRPRVFRSLYDAGEAAVQLVFDEVALEQLAAPSIPGFAAAAARELAVLREWDAALRGTADHKTAALVELLGSRPAGSKAVVFSEYRDTARHLWQMLRRRFAVALLDGGGAWIGESQASRRQVVERFAPGANGGRSPHPRERIDVLVATDVLAEGVNLQDADAVVSYDLPWNPIRLVQRAGRIDRIGSPHDVVHVYNFSPDREFDAFLGLAGTIRRKVETVRTAVGLERPVLEPEPDFEEVARALAAGDAVLDRLDAGTESVVAGFAADGVVPDPAVTAIAAIPGASGRRLVVGLARGRDCLVEAIDATSGQPVSGAEASLRAALQAYGVCEVPVESLVGAAERYACSLNRDAESAGLGRRAAPARLAALIRRDLSALPLEAGEGVYAQADHVLEQLAMVVDAATEERLADLLRRRWISFGALLDAAETAIEAAAPAPTSVDAWRVIAVIAAD